MISHIIILIVAFILLAMGAEYFVEYSARVAKRFSVSDFIIGLTITSIGTSVPELAASVSASLNGYSGIVIGNVVGSNIANVGLILGISATFKAFRTQKKMYERDGFIMIASVLLFFGFALNNSIGLPEAIIMLLSYIFYLFFLIKTDKSKKEVHFRDFMKYVFDFEYISPLKSKLYQIAARKPKEERTTQEKESVRFLTKGLIKDMLVIILSCLAVMFGSKYLVDEAIWLAQLLSVPESIIGLSLIAVGTSLPELTVSLSAVRKGKGGMVVGNVLGSNIANVLLVIGVSGTINPMAIAEISVTYTIPILLFFSLGLLYFIKSDWQIKRYQGVLAIFAYITFMILAFVLGWS